MTNEFDKRVKRVLEEYPSITDPDKEDIWNQLDQQLFAQTQARRSIVKRKKGILVWSAAAVAALCLFVSSQTSTGHAVVDQIKAMFAPQKEIEQHIEGNKEKTNVELEQGTKAEYVIYVGKERYKLVKGEENDKIVLKEPLSENYPDVEMEIRQITNQTPQTVIKKMEKKLREQNKNVSELTEVTEPVRGWMIRSQMGNQWDSMITKIYAISNGHQGAFVIIQRYFLEAEEGHGARFDSMLKNFLLSEKETE